MRRLGDNFSSIEKMTDQYLKGSMHKDTKASSSSNSSFQEVLKNAECQKSSSLKFSKHANSRLSTRNINLSAEQMERLENGTTKARAKGIQESLVMVDDLAFIVNVKNNTVITAVGEAEDSVFTNIDGAVIG